MNQATIILVHTGPSQVPSHALELLNITRKVAKKSRIVFLASEKNLELIQNHSNEFKCDDGFGVAYVAIESFPESDTTRQFNQNSLLDRSFRDGFWFNASKRFFVLADYINYAGVENILHLENDYVLYFDPTDKLTAFNGYADFAVPLDRVRAIPGIVWIKNARVANRLVRFIAKNCELDDMANLGQFCINSNEVIAKPFPTIPRQYVKTKNLNQNKFLSGIDEFGGVFDAAAVGQYIGGIHWMNHPGDTTFFVNESSDLNLNDFSFSWGVKDGLRFPVIIFNDEITQVLGIHAHSKAIDGISPFNHGVPRGDDSLVTGERLQASCEVTISAPSITGFHGRENIGSKELLELPEDLRGNLAPPSNELIDRVSKAKSIFVYTHLIPYFTYYLAPRIKIPFTLVTHNSDHSVSIMDYQLLNNPFLRYWFAQNSEFSHSKLKPLPIGLQNSQWGPKKREQLIKTGKSIVKTKNLYVNFTERTHPSRANAIEAIKNLKNVTIQSGVAYDQYLENLAMHKFCLCPRGNGIDTHRFWEAQYLDCIPVILSCDWTPAYSEMPILILENWGEIESIDLEKIYIAITNKKYARTSLDLQKIIKQINDE